MKLALAGEFVPDAVNVGGGVVNEEVAPWLDLVRKLGVLVATLSDGPPVSLSVQVRGELASEDVEVLKLSALRGLFSAVVEGPVTFVNAPALAAERGVTAEITTATRKAPTTAASSMYGPSPPTAPPSTSPVRWPGRSRWRRSCRSTAATSIMRAEGTNLVINYFDQPGALGKIGTLLGAAGVNIHAAQLSEDVEGPAATILLRLSRNVPEDVRTAIAAAVGANKLEVVDLS